MYRTGVYREGAQKRVVRAKVYLEAIRHLGNEKFYSGDHVVLGGKGGDIAALIEMGVPPSQIYCAENKAHLVRNLRHWYPGVNVYCEDVLRTIARAKKPVTINLDFCGKLREELIEVVAASVQMAGNLDTFFSVTIFSCREQSLRVRSKVSDVARETSLAAPFARCEMLLREVKNSRLSRRIKRGMYIAYSTSKGSPMGVLTFRLGIGEEPEIKCQYAHLLDERIMVCELMDMDLRSAQAAGLVGVNRQQAAGWRAKITRARNQLERLKQWLKAGG